MSRHGRLQPGDLDEEQSRLYEAITSGPRGQGPQAFALADADGALRGPFSGFLLAPALGEAMQRVGAAVRYQTGLTERCRELAILVVAAGWRSRFEREAHEAVGRSVGLTDDVLSALWEELPVPVTDETEQATVELTRALVAGDVDDETWDRCAGLLGERTSYELIVLVGYYAALALQMRVLRSE